MWIARIRKISSVSASPSPPDLPGSAPGGGSVRLLPVTAPDLMAWLGLEASDPARIRQLAAQGVVVRRAHGKYDLFESVRGYCNWLRREAKALRAGPGMHENEPGASLSGRARREEIEAEIASLKLAAMRRDRIPADEVRVAWASIVGAVRARLLSLHAGLAGEVIRAKDQTEAAALIRRAIESALEELSRTMPYDAPATGAPAAPGPGGGDAEGEEG